MSTLSISATVTDSTGNATTVTTSCTIDDFVLGTTEPTAANTGLGVLGLTTADLTVINGDLIINSAWVTANGQTLDRVWVKGHVVFTATLPVTITNSRIQGRTFATPGSPPQTAIVHARSTSTPATALLHLTNCEIFPVQPDVNLVCMSGERLGNVRRCNVYHGSDLINYWGSVPKVHGCYLHDYTFWANDPKHLSDGSHPGWSHNDLIQNSGSDGGDIYGNSGDCRAAVGLGDVATLVAGGFPDRDWGSHVMLTGSTAYITNIEVERNWLYFGQAPICMPLQSSGAFENEGCSWEVKYNQFGDLPHAYSTNQRQLIRWGNKKELAKGASCFGNTFMNIPSVPVALRGTALPVAVLVGPNDQTGQLIVRVNA